MRNGTIAGASSATNRLRVCLAAIGMLAPGGALYCQQNVKQQESATVIHGRVLNRVTKAPIARALVTMAGNQYATMTDDHGQFEITVEEKTPQLTSNMVQVSNRFIETRKPGFLPSGRLSYAGGSSSKEQAPLTLYLVPEALIAGHVEVPGTEGEVRIECELYRRGMNEGREEWTPVERFSTWFDGEFRFSNLRAGIYRLITHEQMDRDSMMQAPGMQLFGYPPVYYQNTTDFSAATPITVHAGETARVDLTVTRKEYYPVRIPVANAPSVRSMSVMVYPMGHRSPGWSLGYNPMEGTIEGILPDGNYTVEADAIGESSGITNFSVRAKPAQGVPLQLLSNSQVVVNIHDEFSSTQQSNSVSFFGGSTTQDPNVNVRLAQIHVRLVPADEMGEARALGNNTSEPVPESQGRILRIRNVRPGSYLVRVVTGSQAYASSIQTGGVDLMKQPLVVGMGSAVAPIEVTLRDDVGDISGTIEHEEDSDDSQRCNIYLLPETGNSQLRQTVTWQGNGFDLRAVPPGDYLLIGFDQPQDTLQYGSEEALRPMEAKGKRIHVEPGQKISVSVKVADGSEAQ
jgi:hypothetical protein